MNPKNQPTKHSPAYAAVATILVGVGLLAAPASIQGDTMLVACGDRIEKFDLATGADLGVFASSGLSDACGMAFDSIGNLYVANRGNGTIMRFTWSGVGSLFARTSFSGAYGLAIDRDGNVYTADLGYHQIEGFTPNGVRSVLLDTRAMNSISGLAFDSSGSLYAAIYDNNTIMRFTQGQTGSVFATLDSSGEDGPQGLAFDKAGNLYVALTYNGSIQKITPDGRCTFFASAGFRGPVGIAFDGAGNLYAANWSVNGNTIQKFLPDGTSSTLASTGLRIQFIAIQPGPPSITVQPSSQTVFVGTNVTFSVGAMSSFPLTYQWTKDGNAIPGATNLSFTVSNVQLADAGQYSITVSDPYTSTNSSAAALVVQVPDAPRTATGTAILTGGFVTTVSITYGGYGYTNTPLVHVGGGGGSGAQAFAVVNNCFVTSITVTNAGYGYTNAPFVFIDPPFIPNPVLGIAAMSFLSFSNLTIGGNYQLQQAVAWYWANQPVRFTATNALYTQMVAGAWNSGDFRLALNPVPAQAFATAQVVNGFVVGATVTNGGAGYITAPSVNIHGNVGSNATAVASISGGVVTNVSITDAGIGYTNFVQVQIAPPPAAAVFPMVQPVMRVDSASLAPYHNYQIQFTPVIGGTWENWNGGLFTATDVTDSQFLFVTNGTGFFRLLYEP